MQIIKENTTKSSRGLNLAKELAEQSQEDWIFGEFSVPCLAEIPENVREQYLPQGERQNMGQEKSDCASRGPVNIMECKFNWLWKNGKLKNRQWLLDNSYVQDNKITFSDRFVAINSGTTLDGNSLKAPLEAIRKQGMIPKQMFPQVERFDDYYSGITDKMIKLGEEFAKRFTLNYEKVYENDYSELLKKDLLDVGGYAWPNPINGEYPNVSYPPNHCFIIFKRPMSYAFDNYEETPNDWIKKLAEDYDFYSYGYRLYISEETVIQECCWQRFLFLFKRKFGLSTIERITILQKLAELYKQLMALIIKKKEVEQIEDKNEKVYQMAKSLLGTKVRTVSKELACAECINIIYKKATGQPVGGDVSTHRMYNSVRLDKRFQQAYEPFRGCLIISPAGFGRFEHGHVGVVGDNGEIFSNNSNTGFLDDLWTIKTWENYYGKQGKFPVDYYKLV